MTPQQLIEERKKYGIPEQGYGSQSSVSKSAIDNSIAELENAWTPKAEPSTISKVGESAKELFTPTVETGKGILKGAGSTIYGAGQLGEKILRGTVGKGVEAITGKPLGEQTYKEEKPKILQPEGGYQKLGYGAEKIAEFFIPAGKVGQVENIIKATTKANLLSKLIPIVGQKTASFLAKTGEVGLRSILRGTEAGGITAIQQGEVGKEAGIATGIGAAMPIVSEGVGLLKKALPSIFEFTSGVPKKAIEKRMIDIAENKAIAPTEQTVENIRTKAVKEYQNLSKELGDEFSQGLENISKNVPRIGQARTVAKEAIPKGISKEEWIKGQGTIRYHQTFPENVPKIIKEGFRFDTRKSAVNDYLPTGVSTKSNANEIGIHGKGSQLEVIIDKSVKVKSFNDRESLVKYLSDNSPDFNNAHTEIGKIDRKYNALHEELLNSGDLSNLKVKSSKLLEEWKLKVNEANQKAQKISTDFFKKQGIDVVELKIDKGGFGKGAVDNTIVLNPSKIKTRSQLSSLYDEAAKGVTQPLAQEARKAEDLLKEGQFKTLMENAKENVPKTLRDFRISVQKSGEILDFDKLNSAIVSPSEQRQIQKVWETLKNQSDFSVKGVQDTAARINALADFTEGAKTQTSAVVGKIHNVYDKAIKEVYPELGALRDKYAQTSKVLGEIGNVIGSKANKPTQIQQAVTRLSNLFKEDKETYINAIQELSKRSGVDFLNLLSSTEFQKVLPDFIRGFGGGATVSVAASLLNPWLIALAPLFSPRGVSTALKIGAKAPDISRVIEALPSALKNSGNE